MERVLASYQCGLGLIPDLFVTCGLRLLLVLILALRVFLRIPPSTKTNTPKFQFNLEIVDKKSHLVECPLLNSNFIFPFLLVQSQCET